MKFESFNQSVRTVYPVFLAGFHDSRALDGTLFLNPQDAYRYCEGKVIHVKEVPFYSQEAAENFVKMKAHGYVNHCQLSLGIPVDLEQIECIQFKKEVETLLNE